jgi:hypothetical protein
MRPKQAVHSNRESHAGARIECEQLLAHAHIEHSEENAGFLMNRRWLQPSTFNESGSGLPARTLLQSPTKIFFNIVG